MKTRNEHESRELWLKAATAALRPHFDQNGYDLPDKIRFSIGFTSTGRKSKRIGEMWHPAASKDGTYELFIRPDMAEPVEVLTILTAKLIHSVLPPEAGHGKLYKEAALKIGLQGKMREPTANSLFADRLKEIAEQLGPLPHAALDITLDPSGLRPAGRPKKQSVRHLKAKCAEPGCGYIVRVAAKWVKELGPPHCPKHGPMTVAALTSQPDETEEDEESESVYTPPDKNIVLDEDVYTASSVSDE